MDETPSKCLRSVTGSSNGARDSDFDAISTKSSDKSGLSPRKDSAEACSDLEKFTELSGFDLNGEWDDDVVANFCNILRDELLNCAVDSDEYRYALNCLDHMEFMFCAISLTWDRRRGEFKVYKKLLKLKTEELKEEAHKLSAKLLEKTEGCGPQGLIRQIEKEHKNLYEHGSSRTEMWTAMLMSDRKLRAAVTEEMAPFIPKIATETDDALGLLLEVLELSSTIVVVPLELKNEQKEFLKSLCDFWSIRCREVSLYHQTFSYDSD